MHHHLPPDNTCTKHLLPPVNFLPPNTITTNYHLPPTTTYLPPPFTGHHDLPCANYLFTYFFISLYIYLHAVCCYCCGTPLGPHLYVGKCDGVLYCCVTWEFSVICVRLGSRITHILLYTNFVCFFLLVFFATSLSYNLNYLGWTQYFTDALWVTS